MRGVSYMGVMGIMGVMGGVDTDCAVNIIMNQCFVISN